MEGNPTVAVVVEHAWHRVPGGTGTATDATIRALLRRGDVDLVGLAAAHRRAPADPPPIATARSRLPRPVLYESWHRLGRPRSGAGSDVIWAPSMAVPPASAPLVVTVHDLDFLEHPERLSRRGASFFPRAWRAATERADAIVAPSRVVATKIADQGIAPDRIEVVPWGVDTRRVPPSVAEEVARRLGLPDRFVLWVGTAEPRKNLPGLVAAMRRPPLDAVPLVVAGPEGWGIDRAETLAPLGSNAVVLGRLDRADLRAVYARATVFAFPSFDEGFGLPVLEAMAQGVPVVTSRGTATEEAAGGAATLVDPDDVDSISQAIARLWNDDAMRAERRRAGAARAADATWDRTAAEYRAVFGEVANP